MKLGPVTKLDKRINVKKIHVDAMSENGEVIAIFPIHGQFGAIQKPDSQCIVCKPCCLIVFCKKMLTSAKLKGLGTKR